jgi:hypothetical protein
MPYYLIMVMYYSTEYGISPLTSETSILVFVFSGIVLKQLYTLSISSHTSRKPAICLSLNHNALDLSLNGGNRTLEALRFVLRPQTGGIPLY